jgi:hypothetical protein
VVDGRCSPDEVAEFLRADFDENGDVSRVEVFRQFAREVDVIVRLALIRRVGFSLRPEDLCRLHRTEATARKINRFREGEPSGVGCALRGALRKSSASAARRSPRRLTIAVIFQAPFCVP